MQKPRRRRLDALGDPAENRRREPRRPTQEPLAIGLAPHDRLQALLHNPERKLTLELRGSPVQHEHPAVRGTLAHGGGERRRYVPR